MYKSLQAVLVSTLHLMYKAQIKKNGAKMSLSKTTDTIPSTIAMTYNYNLYPTWSEQ